MRILFFLAIAAIPLQAQNPVVHLNNTTRPGSSDFEVGDRFEIAITAAANQPVSVRTTMHGRTDWGPVIGWTDTGGRWSTAGQFEKGDFGDWGEAWTVGGKLANPVVRFSVDAPCLKGGKAQMAMSGINTVLSCETAQGVENFRTPSDIDPFHTPDGRVISPPGRLNMTAEQYHAEIIQYLITSRPTEVPPGWLGDEAGSSITKMIGVNALTEDETRNVLAIVRAAFEFPDRILQAARDSSATLLLLQNLSNAADQTDLKQQIAEATDYVRLR
jgi:hypothetical protein